MASVDPRINPTTQNVMGRGELPVLDLNDPELGKWRLVKSWIRNFWMEHEVLAVYDENLSFPLPIPPMSSPNADVDIAVSLLREHEDLLHLDPELRRYYLCGVINASADHPVEPTTTKFNVTEPATCRFCRNRFTRRKPHNLVYEFVDRSGGVDMAVLHPGNGCTFFSDWRVVTSANGPYIHMKELIKVVCPRPLALWYRSRIMQKLSNIREAFSKEMQKRMDKQFPLVDHPRLIRPARPYPVSIGVGQYESKFAKLTGRSGRPVTPANIWTPPEQTAFGIYLATHGRNYQAIADQMQTKTPKMCERYFRESVKQGNIELLRVAQEAERQNWRGEPSTLPRTDASLPASGENGAGSKAMRAALAGALMSPM